MVDATGPLLPASPQSSRVGTERPGEAPCAHCSEERALPPVTGS